MQDIIFGGFHLAILIQNYIFDELAP